MGDAGCGSGRSHSSDARLGSDAPLGSDTMPDRPATDRGPDDTMSALCFGPTDCPGGLTCCVTFNATDGRVGCQASCIGDGVTTLIVCATAADCPPAEPACVLLTVTQGRDFDVCQPMP